MVPSGSGDAQVDDPGGGPGSPGERQKLESGRGMGNIPEACIRKVYEFWVWLRYVEQVCQVGLERAGEFQVCTFGSQIGKV